MPPNANPLTLEISSNEDEEERARSANTNTSGVSPNVKESENGHSHAASVEGKGKAKEEFDSVIPPKSNYLLDVSIEKSKAQLLTQKRHSSQLLKSSSQVIGRDCPLI